MNCHKIYTHLSTIWKINLKVFVWLLQNKFRNAFTTLYLKRYRTYVCQKSGLLSSTCSTVESIRTKRPFVSKKKTKIESATINEACGALARLQNSKINRHRTCRASTFNFDNRRDSESFSDSPVPQYLSTDIHTWNKTKHTLLLYFHD